MTIGGSTCCAPQGAERIYPIPFVFLSQWALLEMRSSRRPSTRRALLTGFCERTCSPPRAGSRVLWQGLAHLKSTEKAKAASLSSRSLIQQPTQKACRACCLSHCSCTTHPSRLHFSSEVFTLWLPRDSTEQTTGHEETF